MRYLFTLLLIVMAVPSWSAEYYVNAGDMRARNLPAAQGYGTIDSPWITPSYAVAQVSGSTAASHDTVYIYGYALTDTSDYYLDNCTYFDEYIDWIGVSVDGDSPTFTKSGLFLYGRYVNTGSRPSSCSINGIRFTNITNANPNAIINQSNGATTSWHHDYIENCIFYNNKGVTTANSAGVVLFTIDRLAASTVADSNILTIRNCSFYNNGTPSIFANHYNSVANSYGYIEVDNCSFRNDSIVLTTYKYGGVGSDTSFYMTDCIVDDCDTFLRYFRDNTSAVLASARVSYTDTYNITNNHQGINAGTGGIYVQYSNIYNVQPNWATEESTDTYLSYLYLDASASTPFTDGSSTGGLIGVLWGWTAPAAPTTTLNYLYRGMNLMQRFEIIRRR